MENYDPTEFAEDFIGFYTRKGFWVDRRLDLHKLGDARRLCGIIGEVMCTFESAHFKAAVTVEGMVLLHCRGLARDNPIDGDARRFDEAIDWREQFLTYAYALQVFLESCSIRSDCPAEIHIGELTPDNTTTVSMFSWEPLSSSAQGSRFINEDIRDLNSYVDFVRRHARIPQHFTFSAFRWTEIPSQTLQLAFTKFERVASQPSTLKWLSFIARSKVAYNKNDFTMSFLLCWFVIESSCKVMYAREAEPDGPPDGEEVKATMHSILKKLVECNLLTPEAHALIQQVKKKRNALIHQPDRTPVLSRDCLLAGQLATDLAARGQDADLVLNWNCSVSY